MRLITLHMTVTCIHSWHAYGHGLLSFSYMTLLVMITIYICVYFILYMNGGTPVLCEPLPLQSPLPNNEYMAVTDSGPMKYDFSDKYGCYLIRQFQYMKNDVMHYTAVNCPKVNISCKYFQLPTLLLHPSDFEKHIMPFFSL